MLRFLPLLPPTIPLLGAAALAIIPRRRISDAVRRWIVAGAFLTAWLALALAYSVRAAMQPPSFVGPVLGPSERVWVFFDPLAAHVGLLLLGGGVLLQVAVLDMPIERFHAVCLLVALGSAVVSLTTDSLYVLCVAWGTMDLALMGYSARTMTSQRGATRYLAGGLMSTAALSVALVLALGWQRDTQMSSLALTGAPLAWLAAAALLRLGSYPLPGSFGGSWEVFLLSLCTGGYLWLRVGGLFAPLPPQMGALLPMTGATLLLTGALAALAPDPMSARRYILYNGVSISICAVLLDPQSGSTLALLNLVNLGLGLALSLVTEPGRPISSPLARLLLRAVALATLGGWPLTLGFVCHWAFLRLCWLEGAYSVGLLGALGYLLTNVALWASWRQTRRREALSVSPASWMTQVAFPCAAVAAGAIVLMGLSPMFFSRVWLGAPTAEPPLSLAAMLFGRLDLRGGVALLLATGASLWGGRALYRGTRAPSPGAQRAADVTGAILELDWLYVGLENALLRVQHIADGAIAALEGPFYLTWLMAWMVGAVLALKR